MPVIYTGAVDSGPVLDAKDIPGRILQGRTAAIGDAVFGAVDQAGVRVWLTAVKGWDTTASTGTVEQQPSDHGGWPTPAQLAPRVLELTLELQARTWEQITPAIERIEAAVPLSVPAPLTINDHGVERTCLARQEGDPLVDRNNAWARMSLSLVAPDPRRYSTEVMTDSTGLPSTAGGLTVPLTLPATLDATMTSGRVTTVNAGNFSTPAVLVVRGPCPPFRITHMGQGATLRYHEAVGPGRFVHIDTANRRVLLDGIAARRVTGTWFHYVPGVNEVAFSADTYEPAARLTTTFRSAWK